MNATLFVPYLYDLPEGRNGHFSILVYVGGATKEILKHGGWGQSARVSRLLIQSPVRMCEFQQTGSEPV